MSTEAGKAALTAYKAAVKADKRIQTLQKRIDEGRGTYAIANGLASRSGIHAGKAIAQQLVSEATDGQVERELAAAILQPTMVENYKTVSSAAGSVQRAINKRAGLGLAPVIPDMNQDRIDGLVEEIVNAIDVGNLASTLISQVENASLSILDDSVSDNMDFQYNAGRNPVIIRTAEAKCCEWCEALAGTYDYEDVKRGGSDVYRRHENCRCIVEFDPGVGSLQNVHTKKMVSRADVERRRFYQENMISDMEYRRQERKRRYGSGS